MALDAGSREFDLTRYAPIVRDERRRGTGILFLIGLAFALGGVALLGYGSYEYGFPGIELTAEILAIFVGVGSFFFWVPIVRFRPWETPKCIRIGPTGFEIEQISGRVQRFSWDVEGLAVEVREANLEGVAGSGPVGERLLVVPGVVTGVISRDAREILMDGARRHGFAYLEEQYRGRLSLAPDSPVTIIRRAATRFPLGAVPPTDAWPFPELTAGSALPSRESFELAKGSYRPDALGLDRPIKGGTLAVDAAGITVVRANGRKQRFEFSDPRFLISFGRRLESAVTPLDAPRGLWHVSFGHAESGLFVSGAAWAAIVSAAESTGLDVRSETMSLPDRPVWRWVANTQIKSPRRRRAGQAPSNPPHP